MAIRTEKDRGIDTDFEVGTDSKIREKVLHAPTLFHEVGDNFSGSDMTDWFEVPPSRHATKVVVRSIAIPPSGNRRPSPEYLASLRRRKTKKIAESIVALSRHAQDEGFALWTEKVVDDLRKAIQFLSDEEEFCDPPHEANSCEVLRQVRDSFLNGGWEKYRRPEVRGAALSVLKRLSGQDEVSGEDVSSAFDELLQAGLDGAVFPIQGMFADDNEEVPD